jgi:membrane protease YdiL (CAAX protease family)
MFLLRAVGPVLLAMAAVVAIDRLTSRRGLRPPGFDPKRRGDGPAVARRGLAMAVLAGVLWLGVFGPLATIGTGIQPDFSQVHAGHLFLLHGLFAATLAIWYVLGFAGTGGSWTAQLGFNSKRPLPEIGIGLAAGVGGWLTVLGVMVALGSLIWVLGGQELLPERPPALIPWLAGLPIWMRLAVSMSAGVVEEAFFRGFLQPRVGISLSTALFVLAHAGYEQPLMLVGVTLLSLLFALLVRWRQNIWAAIVAHAVFDAVQLLIVVPIALEFAPAAEGDSGLVLGALAPLVVW